MLQVQHMQPVTRETSTSQRLFKHLQAAAVGVLSAMLQGQAQCCTAAAAQLHLLKLSQLVCCLANIAAPPAAAAAAANAKTTGVVSTTMQRTYRTSGAPAAPWSGSKLLKTSAWPTRARKRASAGSGGLLLQQWA
jgi:hypothetical protein